VTSYHFTGESGQESGRDWEHIWHTIVTQKYAHLHANHMHARIDEQ